MNVLSRLSSKLLGSVNNRILSANTVRPVTKYKDPTTNKWVFSSRQKLISMGLLTGAATGLLLYALEASVEASDGVVHPPHQNWGHKGILSAIDKEGVRRGYQVYKEVCASCHSCQYIAYRNLVGTCMTEAEAKAEAEGITVKDGPDENGMYFDRPGKLSDHFPAPYENEEAARAANNGAYPPDLSYIVYARKGGEDYIFSLLTGYCEPPAGVVLRDGQYFNPYFAGGAISMGQVITNELVTYADEEVAPSASQIAKDVVTFLKWTSEPDFDDRKILLIKVCIVSSVLIGLTYYIKRFKWSSLKSRKIFYAPRDGGDIQPPMRPKEIEKKTSRDDIECK